MLRGFHHSEETKRKISEHSASRKAKIEGRHWMKGFKHTEISKIKISKNQPRKFGKSNSMFGKTKEKHHNYKGGVITYNFRKNMGRLNKKEIIAGRKKPTQCEVCGGIGTICFDHNHETGEFRGWICTRCNVALGMVSNKTEILELLIKYLNKNKKL